VTTGYSAKALPRGTAGRARRGEVARVVIAFDRDKAGEDGAEAVAAQLMARASMPPVLSSRPRCEQLRPGRHSPEKSWVSS